MPQMQPTIDLNFRHLDYRHEIEMRAAETEENEYYVLEGKAVTFDEATVLFKVNGIEYKEIIDRAAFDGADISNVFLKFNHESSWIGAARTKNGTLTLDVREDGVYITARLKKSLRWCEDLYQAVRAGLIDKMSFAFSINEESFNEETHTWTVRKIGAVYDVAAVEIPAYDNTYIYARRKGDVEARLKEVEASRLEHARSIALAKIKNSKGGNKNA